MTTASGPDGPRSDGPDAHGSAGNGHNPSPDGGAQEPYPPPPGQGAGRQGGPVDGYSMEYVPAPAYGAYLAPGQSPAPFTRPGEPHRLGDPRDARRPARLSAVGIPIRSGPPVVTYAVIGLLVVVFLLQRVTNVQSEFLYWPAVTEYEPWRMLTAALVHSGFPHILFNVYATWIVGQALEPAIGRWRLVVLMVLSAFGGSVAVLLLSGGPGSQGWVTGVVGFSGAVMGLFAAVLAIQRRIGQDSTQLLVLLGINIVIGFVPGWNIAWQAHLGGMVAGGILGAAWSIWNGARPNVAAAVSAVALALVMVGACAFYLA